MFYNNRQSKEEHVEDEYTVYRVIFFALLHMWTVSSHLKFAQTQCVKRDYSVLLQFAQSRIRPLTTRVKGAKIKRGPIFPFIQYIYI